MLTIVVDIIGALVFFFLWVIGFWAIFYMLSTALFISCFTGLLVTFVALCNTIIFTYKFSSNIAAFLLKDTVGNLLYPPVTRRRQLFWSRFSGIRFIFRVPEPPSYISHSCEPYTIASQITALYRRRDRRTEGPHMDTIGRKRVLYATLFFSIARNIYFFHIIFGLYLYLLCRIGLTWDRNTHGELVTAATQ